MTIKPFAIGAGAGAAGLFAAEKHFGTQNKHRALHKENAAAVNMSADDTLHFSGNSEKAKESHATGCSCCEKPV